MPRFLMLLWVPVVVLAVFVFSGERAKAEEALASWYGPGFSGLPTASGEPYDPFGFTAAHKTMPLGTELLIGYGGNSVEVIVNDRGPYVGERELDLSQSAAQAIGLTEAGVDVVQYSSTDQYAAPEPDLSITQDASATQYDAGVAATPESPVYETQYAAEIQPAVSDQYAVAPAPVEEPEVPTAAEEASATGTGSYSPGSVTSIDASSAILVVRPGETLSGLAQESGVSLDHLAAQNEIADLNLIYAGQILYY